MNYSLIFDIFFLEKYKGNATWVTEVEKYFSSRLSSSWNSIPSLNATQIKDLKNGQLVRFRAMIQDQLGPEMYASGAELRNTATGTQRLVVGKYMDEIPLEVNSCLFFNLV